LIFSKLKTPYTYMILILNHLLVNRLRLANAIAQLVCKYVIEILDDESPEILPRPKQA